MWTVGLAAPSQHLPEGTESRWHCREVCVSVHVHVPDRSFVHVWIPACAVTAGLENGLSPIGEGVLMGTQCG